MVNNEFTNAHTKKDKNRSKAYHDPTHQPNLIDVLIQSIINVLKFVYYMQYIVQSCDC